MMEVLLSLFDVKSSVFDSVVSLIFGGGLPHWQERKNSIRIRIIIKAVTAMKIICFILAF